MADGTARYYLSDAAYKEYQSQKAFDSLEDLIQAMPPSVQAVHVLPADRVPADGVPGYVKITSDADLFGPYSNLYEPDSGGLKDPFPPRSYPVDMHSMPEPYADRPQNYLVEKSPEGDEYLDDLDEEAASAALYNRPALASIGGYGGFGKTSMLWAEIVGPLSNDIKQAARSCKVSLKRADPTQGRWTFRVGSGSGKSYTVHVKAVPRKGAASLEKVDLKLGCSCDYWKWQGPDYWANKHGYLDKSPRSNGAAPDVRDPQQSHRVCKHVYAAAGVFLQYKLRAKISSTPDTQVDFNKLGLSLYHITPVSVSSLVRKASLTTHGCPQSKLASDIHHLATKINKHEVP